MNDFVFRWNNRHKTTQEKMAAAFGHFNKTVTRQQILEYDTRSRYRTIEHKWTFEQLVDVLSCDMIQTVEVNGTWYTLEDAKKYLALGLKYPI